MSFAKKLLVFYKFRAHSGDLHELKKCLADLKDERGRIDTLAPQYAQLVAGRATTKALYDTAIKTRGDIRGRMDEITRLLNALPRMSAFVPCEKLSRLWRICQRLPPARLKIFRCCKGKKSTLQRVWSG